MNSGSIRLTLVLAAAVLLSAAAASASSDRAYAYRINLHLADFPAGWTAHADRSPQSACGKPRTAGLRPYVTLRSPKFRRSASITIQSRSYVLERPGDAATLERRWAALPFGACLRSEAPKVGLRASHVSTSPMSFDRLGSRTSARRVFAHVTTAKGAGANVYQDYIFVQKGRGVTGFFFSTVGYKPPLWDERRLTHAVARRM
jgi:hypothetical protein